MSDERWQNHTKSLSSPRMVGRYALALLILGAVILYLVQSLSGKIHQIDAPTVGLLVVTIVLLILLITPGLTDRLSRIEVSGLKLEILRKEQLRQRDELDEFSLIFPILLPETERKHLMNLAHGSTANYKGNHNLRSELRRLRSIGLLCMRPNQQMSFIKDGMTVELANYVELTSLGQKWVRRIEDAESAEAKAAAAGIDSRSRAG